MTAKLQQVTQLLGTLTKDLQEKQLSPTREFSDEVVAIQLRLMYGSRAGRKGSDPSTTAPAWHESHRRRTDLLQRRTMKIRYRVPLIIYWALTTTTGHWTIGEIWN